MLFESNLEVHKIHTNLHKIEHLLYSGNKIYKVDVYL